MGLVINETKIKYMSISAKHDLLVIRQDLSINNHVFEHVEELVYLGSLMRNDGDTTCKIKRRIVLLAELITAYEPN